MSIFLEITQLENGDIVLRETDEELETVQEQQSESKQGRLREPLVRISFSDEVRDMLGEELVGVAEAMIDAATDFLGDDAIDPDAEVETGTPAAPVIH
jgi:hypothetical protein